MYTKNITEKKSFCSNTVNSDNFKTHTTFNTTLKIHESKPLAFSLRFLFPLDQNHYSKITPKIIHICEHIIEKTQRPNTIQITSQGFTLT